MGQYLDMIVSAARRTRGYADQIAAGIEAKRAARKPRFRSDAGETVVDCNHPTFVYGHLAIYPARLAGMLGLGDAVAAQVAAPATYPDLFKAGVECKDDVEGTIYPAWADVLASFQRGYDTILESTKGVDDAVLSRELPDERMRAVFGTVGAAAVFLLTSHVMVHMGQVSTWRRCMGMPAAM